MSEKNSWPQENGETSATRFHIIWASGSGGNGVDCGGGGGGGGGPGFFDNSPTSEWRPMATAPRDGTPIEVRCTYGVAPWYGLYRWIKTPGVQVCRPGGQSFPQEGRWAGVHDEGRSFDEDNSFSWRPYAGNSVTYVDPTGGAQNTDSYWRRAVAAKYGLPPDHFEKKIAPPTAMSWWRRFLP